MMSSPTSGCCAAVLRRMHAGVLALVLASIDQQQFPPVRHDCVFIPESVLVAHMLDVHSVTVMAPALCHCHRSTHYLNSLGGWLMQVAGHHVRLDVLLNSKLRHRHVQISSLKEQPIKGPKSAAADKARFRYCSLPACLTQILVPPVSPHLPTSDNARAQAVV